MNLSCDTKIFQDFLVLVLTFKNFSELDFLKVYFVSNLISNHSFQSRILMFN